MTDLNEIFEREKAKEADRQAMLEHLLPDVAFLKRDAERARPGGEPDKAVWEREASGL